MTTIDLNLPKLHPGQREIAAEAARYNVVCCGRRWGKSFLGVYMAAHPAIDGKPVGWFAPTYKLLLEAWREIVRRLKPVASRISEQERRIELVTGGVVECWSADNPDAGKSRKYARVVVDEVALVPHLEQLWQEAIRPTLVDYAGDAWFLSTPKGLNYFHTLFQWGQDTNRPDWHSWQRPTIDNPYIPEAEIDAMRGELPERIFSQEILAQFLEDGGSVFRGILPALIAKPQESAQVGHSYIIGVDWGKLEDFTVLSVIDTLTNELVCIDRFNQIDYTLQRARLRALWERFGQPSVIAERNSMGEPVIEQLRREGIPVQAFLTTNASKAQIIEGLALAFERAQIAILSDAVLVGELQAFTAERLPSGMLRYSAPSGMHDDCVMSLAMAWYGASKPKQREARSYEG